MHVKTNIGIFISVSIVDTDQGRCQMESMGCSAPAPSLKMLLLTVQEYETWTPRLAKLWWKWWW